MHLVLGSAIVRSEMRHAVVLVKRPSMLTSLLEYLLSRRFEVTWFSHAGSAIAYLRSGDPVDLLITSVNLESSDRLGGCNVARAFHEAFPGAPVIVFTRKDEDDYRMRLLRGIPKLRVARKPFEVFRVPGMAASALGMGARIPGKVGRT